MQAENTFAFGSSIEEIYNSEICPSKIEYFEEIKQKENHTVLYDKLKLLQNRNPRDNNWNLNHVRLPSSSNNVIHIEQIGGGYSNEELWPKIKTSLSKNINSSYDLEKIISEYNRNIEKFEALHAYCAEQLKNDMNFFDKTLPAIIKLALQLPDLIQTKIPLLKQDENHSISLSQVQISCLLANAFLCTFPPRGRLNRDCYSNINFNRLFQSESINAVEKIKCIVNYFERITNEKPVGVLTFIRRSIKDNQFPDWSTINIPLSKTPLRIALKGKIEDQRSGLLQVNFANKFIGGRVLGDGCFQEEIQFIIYPELIISKLFTEVLKDNETLVIIGAEQFNNYKGYLNNFKFDGNYIDSTPFEKKQNNRRQRYIIAIDALNYSNSSDQYKEKFIKRELNKAYVGFYHSIKNKIASGVASGNWGCGALGGDPQLKSLIQLMACTITGRPLYYFTFENISLRNNLYITYLYLTKKNLTIGQLWCYLNEYKDQHKMEEDLFTFIQRKQ